LRVAWSPDLGYAAVAPAVAVAAERAARRFEEFGCHVEEAHPGLPDPWDIEGTIWEAAMAGAFRDRLAEVRKMLDPGLLRVVERGNALAAADLAAAQQRRAAYADGWRRFFERHDLLLTPTLPVTAFAAGADEPSRADGPAGGRADATPLDWTPFTYPFNLTGHPAATVPCGFDADGLPIGLQIVGGWHADATVLRAAAAFETAAPWAHARPPLNRIS
jgi:aspartyl-tRNA(Asn)/glutamyl-tRNA(Gln) amidotransferase subunit A